MSVDLGSIVMRVRTTQKSSDLFIVNPEDMAECEGSAQELGEDKAPLPITPALAVVTPAENKRSKSKIQSKTPSKSVPPSPSYSTASRGTTRGAAARIGPHVAEDESGVERVSLHRPGKRNAQVLRLHPGFA